MNQLQCHHVQTYVPHELHGVGGVLVVGSILVVGNVLGVGSVLFVGSIGSVLGVGTVLLVGSVGSVLLESVLGVGTVLVVVKRLRPNQLNPIDDDTRTEGGGVVVYI